MALSLKSDGEIGRRDITPAGDQIRKDLIPANRDDDYVGLQGSGLILLVDLFLEQLECFIGEASLNGAVQEILGLIGHN